MERRRAEDAVGRRTHGDGEDTWLGERSGGDEDGCLDGGDVGLAGKPAAGCSEGGIVSVFPPTEAPKKNK